MSALPKCNDTESGFDVMCDRLDCQQTRSCIAHSNPQRVMDAVALMCGLPVMDADYFKEKDRIYRSIHSLAIQLRKDQEAKQLARDMGES